VVFWLFPLCGGGCVGGGGGSVFYEIFLTVPTDNIGVARRF